MRAPCGGNSVLNSRSPNARLTTRWTGGYLLAGSGAFSSGLINFVGMWGNI